MTQFRDDLQQLLDLANENESQLLRTISSKRLDDLINLAYELVMILKEREALLDMERREHAVTVGKLLELVNRGTVL